MGTDGTPGAKGPTVSNCVYATEVQMTQLYGY